MWKALGLTMILVGTIFGLFSFIIGPSVAIIVILCFTSGIWMILLGINDDLAKVTRNQQRILTLLKKVESQLEFLLCPISQNQMKSDNIGSRNRL